MKTSKVFKDAETGDTFTFSYAPQNLNLAQVGDILEGKNSNIYSYYSLLRHSTVSVADSYFPVKVRVVGEEITRHWEDNLQCVNGEMINAGKNVEYRMLVVEKLPHTQRR